MVMVPQITGNTLLYVQQIKLCCQPGNRDVCYIEISAGRKLQQKHIPLPLLIVLTHWGRVTHICVGKLTIIGSGNSLSPGRRQAIIWTNAGILLIGPVGTNLSKIVIAIETFSFKKMHLKILSAKWRPFCLGPNVLNLVWGVKRWGLMDFMFWTVLN